jgi:hypothetical protein
VVVERPPHPVGVERLAPAHDLGERHHDAGQAVAALAGVVGHERGLHRGARGVGGQAGGRGHGAVADVAEGQRARPGRGVADKHAAGAALLGPAAVLGAPVADLAPQDPQQRGRGVGLHPVEDAVDLQRHRHRSQLSCPSRTAARRLADQIRRWTSSHSYQLAPRRLYLVYARRLPSGAVRPGPCHE